MGEGPSRILLLWNSCQPFPLGDYPDIVYYSMLEVGLTIIAACLPTLGPLFSDSFKHRLSGALQRVSTSLPRFRYRISSTDHPAMVSNSESRFVLDDPRLTRMGLETLATAGADRETNEPERQIRVTIAMNRYSSTAEWVVWKELSSIYTTVEMHVLGKHSKIDGFSETSGNEKFTFAFFAPRKSQYIGIPVLNLICWSSTHWIAESSLDVCLSCGLSNIIILSIFRIYFTLNRFNTSSLHQAPFLLVSSSCEDKRKWNYVAIVLLV